MILTLTILAVVLLLLMAFVTSMRTERMVAKNYNDLAKARMLADAALDQAVAAIKNATPPAPPAGNSPTITWVAAPGVIYTLTASATPVANPLYTTQTPAGAGTTNLNIDGLITGTNELYNCATCGSSAIEPGWQNVTVNIGGVNELIGRFAYWTDIEATKVDINLAGKRTASDPTSTTDPLMDRSVASDIDLRALVLPFEENAPLIGDASTANTFIWSHSDGTAIPPRPWFSTVEEMRRGLMVVPSTTDGGMGGFTSNKFFVTVGTVDTNTDAFGRDRIDLTQIKSDSGAAFTAAQNSFQDASWGTILYGSIVAPARNTLTKKYGLFGMNQILANIAEYQLPYDPTRPVVGISQGLDADKIPQRYAAIRKGPLIDAVIVHVATNIVDAGGGVTNLEVRAFVDVKLVNGYDVDRGNNWLLKIAAETVSVDYTNGNAGSGIQTVNPTEVAYTLRANVPAHSFRLLGAPSSSTLYLNPNPSFAEAASVTIAGAPGNGAPVATNVSVVLRTVRLLTQNNDNNIVDWLAPVDFTTQAGANGMRFHNGGVGDIVPYVAGSSPNFNKVGGTAGTDYMPIMLGKQDPRVRTFTGLTAADIANAGPNFSTNWFVYPSGGNNARPDGDHSFTSRITPENYGLLADSRSIEPGSGLTCTHRYLIDRITETAFANLGELSYIHTGYPWRTLRLRSVYPETVLAFPAEYGDFQLPAGSTSVGDPNIGRENAEADALPDWVLLDMFRIGNAFTVAGRININTKFIGPANLTARIPPLSALIDNTAVNFSTSLTSGTGSNVDIIAKRIANRTFAPGNSYANLPAYLTPGEICEVSNLVYFSDNVGSVFFTQRPSKTRRQQLIRRISNLITTRSNTFTIWAMAQSIKDVDQNGLYDPPPAGNDLITGEVKVQAIVERYEEGGQVKFRTKYFRYIYE